MDFEVKFSIVKKYVDLWDRMELLSIPCPLDEYDVESKVITDNLNDDIGLKALSQLIKSTFDKYFDIDCDEKEVDSIAVCILTDLRLIKFQNLAKYFNDYYINNSNSDNHFKKMKIIISEWNQLVLKKISYEDKINYFKVTFNSLDNLDKEYSGCQQFLKYLKDWAYY